MDDGFWTGPLEAGEKMLWQGRPHVSLNIRPQDYLGLFLALLSLVAGVYWLLNVPQSAGLIWYEGLVFLGIAPLLLWTTLRAAKREYARTWYSLTSRRAIVSTRGRKGRMDHAKYPISRDSNLRFKEGAFSTIWFAQKHHYRYKGRDVTVDVGFEHIPDGKAVHALLLMVQAGQNV